MSLESSKLTVRGSGADVWVRAELKNVLDASILPEREAASHLRVTESQGLPAAGPIHSLFTDASAVHPTCAGLWLEFGVFMGGTRSDTELHSQGLSAQPDQPCAQTLST